MKEMDQDQIEAYLYDRMSKEQAASFEAKLKTDKALAEALELKRMEKQALRLLAQDQLRAEMSKWKMEKNTELQPEAQIIEMPRRRLIYRLSAAASIIILIGIPLWWVNQNYSNSGLTGENLGFQTSRSDRSNISEDNPLLAALDLAQAGNFEEAVNQLQQLQGTIFEEEGKLLLGEIYSEQGEMVNATNVYLDLIANSTDVIVKQNAEWFLINVYLATDQVDKARELLSEISIDESHLRKNEAEQLLKKLNSFWRKISFS